MFNNIWSSVCLCLEVSGLVLACVQQYCRVAGLVLACVQQYCICLMFISIWFVFNNIWSSICLCLEVGGLMLV